MCGDTSQAKRVIEKFGGALKLSRLLGHKHPTTVRGWLDSGFIPSRRFDQLLALAQKEQNDLKPEDFFDPRLVGAS